jgi:hypothetical protein
MYISIYECVYRSVGLAYGLDRRGSIPGRGKIFLFSIASRMALGPYNGYQGLFPPGGKAVGA